MSAVRHSRSSRSPRVLWALVAVSGLVLVVWVAAGGRQALGVAVALAGASLVDRLLFGRRSPLRSSSNSSTSAQSTTSADLSPRSLPAPRSGSRGL